MKTLLRNIDFLLSFGFLVMGIIADNTNLILGGIGLLISDYVWLKMKANK